MQQSSSKPKVWIVGAGRVCLRIPLLCALRERGFEVGAAGPIFSEEFTENGIPFHHYSLTRTANPFADRRTTRELVQLFQRHRPDLVHAVNTKPSLLAPLAAHRANVPACVRTITGMGALFSSRSPAALALRPVYRQLQRRAERVSDFTIFQNPDDRDYFLRHRMVRPERQSLVLGSGIDVEAFQSGISDATTLSALRNDLGLEGRPVISMVARLLKSKGISEFLQAASLVRREFPEAAFVLIGPPVDGGPSAFPVSRVQSCSDVLFLGRRSDVSDLLAISDLFVLPSYLREGLPRVLLEAGAVGLPLVTTDLPGCREVVRHGENGVLVPARDGQTLASTIFDLLADPARRRRMGQASRELVAENFHLDIVAAAYARIYRQVLRIGDQQDARETRRAA